MASLSIIRTSATFKCTSFLDVIHVMQFNMFTNLLFPLITMISFTGINFSITRYKLENEPPLVFEEDNTMVADNLLTIIRWDYCWQRIIEICEFQL